MESTAVETVIEESPDAEGTIPEELDIVLQRWVETDAIQQLVAHS